MQLATRSNRVTSGSALAGASRPVVLAGQQCRSSTTLRTARITGWAAAGNPEMPRDTAVSDMYEELPVFGSSNGVARGPLPEPVQSVQVEKKGFLQRVKEYFLGSPEEKSKLATLGMGAFASYGCISNVTYGACLTIAWISFVKATGTTPLAAGQWKPFLAFYAGLWTMQNFVRPARFALAVALAPAFERVIASIGKNLRLPKPAAFALLLTGIALTTMACLFTAIWVCGGFPDGLPALSLPWKATA